MEEPRNRHFSLVSLHNTKDESKVVFDSRDSRRTTKATAVVVIVQKSQTVSRPTITQYCRYRSEKEDPWQFKNRL
jgi:hypothetical protein